MIFAPVTAPEAPRQTQARAERKNEPCQVTFRFVRNIAGEGFSIWVDAQCRQEGKAPCAECAAALSKATT